MAASVAQFGVGFRSQHYQLVTEQLPANIDLFEIVSENFMGVGGRPFYFLAKLIENYPIVMHGVGLSIGACRELDPDYLNNLKNLIDRVHPLMVSDHLCWTTYQNHNSHDLLPIAYTQQSLIDIVRKLDQIQNFLGRRFYLENPSAYVGFEYADYSEVEFFCELIKRSGAGIMLDVNNLYVNQANQGLDPIGYLELLPRDAVGYMHLAGHSREEHVIIDTHDHPVCDEVWELYRVASQKFDRVPVIVEWDGNIPSFERLAAEADQARKLHALGALSMAPRIPKRTAQRQSLAVDNHELHCQFMSEIILPYGISGHATQYLDKDLPVPAELGMKVYNNAYFLRANECLNEIFPNIAKLISEDSFHELTASYLTHCPPQHPSIHELGNHLPKFLRTERADQELKIGVELDILADIATIELARAQCFIAPDSIDGVTLEALGRIDPYDFGHCIFKAAPHSQLVRLHYDVMPVLTALSEGRQPSRPATKADAVLIYRRDFVIHTEPMTAWQADFFAALDGQECFESACGKIAPYFNTDDQPTIIATAAKELVRLVQLGLIALLPIDPLSV